MSAGDHLRGGAEDRAQAHAREQEDRYIPNDEGGGNERCENCSERASAHYCLLNYSALVSNERYARHEAETKLSAANHALDRTRAREDRLQRCVNAAAHEARIQAGRVVNAETRIAELEEELANWKEGYNNMEWSAQTLGDALETARAEVVFYRKQYEAEPPLLASNQPEGLS